MQLRRHAGVVVDRARTAREGHGQGLGGRAVADGRHLVAGDLGHGNGRLLLGCGAHHDFFASELKVCSAERMVFSTKRMPLILAPAAGKLFTA